jgi:hypothetical protein
MLNTKREAAQDFATIASKDLNRLQQRLLQRLNPEVKLLVLAVDIAVETPYESLDRNNTAVVQMIRGRAHRKA